MAIPLVTIVGKSKSGKTTLIEGLVREIRKRGFRVGTVKHHSHSGFDIDKPGKDSWRHAQAGSDHVVIAAPDKIAAYRRIDRELTLEEIAAVINDVDIILVEGYKRARMPSIEVIREKRGLELIADPESCIAVAADTPLSTKHTLLDLNDAVNIADFIIHRFLIPRESSS
ncbi:MAG: molybdopterin-guanine dinucleotide biosynthesis protein B [Candidatus Promineifilaceae bacterium]|jgi:molybdopterin-guanine dinucleotide biosynthesis protein B